MWDLYLAVSRRAETLSSMILHVATNIHAFFLGSQGLGLGMDLCRAANIPSPFVGVVGGRRGGALVPPEVLGVFPQGGTVEAS